MTHSGSPEFELYGEHSRVDEMVVDITGLGTGVVITVTFLDENGNVLFAQTTMNAEQGDLQDITDCANKAVDFAIDEFHKRIKQEGGHHE